MLVRADDLARARDFYVEVLGGRLIAEFTPPGLVFVELAGQRLLIEKGELGSLLYFTVDDIEATFEELRAAGVTIEEEPHPIFEDATGQFGEAGRTEWMGFFRDSEGNLVGLAERKASASG